MSPFFEYEAVSKAGSVEHGSVMATDIVDARLKLRRTGLTSVLNLEPAETIVRRRVSRSRLQETLTSLSVLLKGGLPLLAAIQAVSSRSRSAAIRSALLSMSGAVESGQSLTDAAAATGVFPPHLLAGIRVGEESGRLAESLTRAAESLARENAFRRRMEGILMYPLIVFTFSMFVIGFLITFVVPQLTDIFEGSTRPLPLLTRGLLAVSSFVQSAGPWLAAALGMILVFGFFYLKTEKGTRLKERALYRIASLRKIALSRWLAALSTLLDSGLDLVKALGVSKDAVGSREIGEDIEYVREGLRHGRSFSVLVGERPMFDVIPTELLAAGESGGQLRMVCAAAATALEEEAAQELERFAVILEPALILCLGLFAGGIVVSILIPIVDMSRSIQ
ncbi:MAG: hypothetical protein A3G34_13800 [Candidatus Lindowbacteria bacterium RIFCSPLOWO2_12_FULL_62_27]|nr:MAG: hypothetical protein A3I06_12495 [Candidatus Lindowbacteria bacterium RIFCSPLOWO2_02_FULL_62_12]OGH62650.1 MAG: hypothetical protein A3G34_13800 [Candidatus Lindowbacteria bacterium RIFCSPLOWO2_12_FULL_62_27]